MILSHVLPRGGLGKTQTHAEKTSITLKKTSIPLKMYLKSLATLEKSSIFLKNN
jgi:hypothetical protein